MVNNYKIVALPNIVFGDNIINYIVDVYAVDYKLSSGIAARNGYHERPVLVATYSKAPITTTIVDAKHFDQWIKNVYGNNVVIEIIK